MKIKELIPKAAFGTIATIKDEFSIRKLDLFLGYNLPLISQFENVIIALNKADNVSDRVVDEYKNIWSVNVPNAVIIELQHNRGHMFGTIDLEEAILSYIKNNLPKVEYLFKSMDDVITSEILLDLEVPITDFYYLPGFSYESILKAGGKDNLYNIYETFESGFFTPQTTFFIVRIDGIISIYGNDIDDKYRVYTEAKKSMPEIKPWEIPFDIKFDCETHLGRTVKNMSKHCIVLNKFKELLDLVEKIPIMDPSHKNVLFKDIGVCHYHFYEQAVYEI